MSSMPEYRVSFRGSFASTGWFEIQSRSGVTGVRSIHYEHGDVRLQRMVGAVAPAALRDLNRVLLALRDVDRAAPRSWSGDRREKARGPRRLVITFPVEDIEFWSSGHAEFMLRRLVSTMSGDVLEPSFEPISSHANFRQSQLRLDINIEPEIDAVTLFSGGIDSLYGMLDCLHETGARRILAVSANTNSRHTGLQRRIIKALLVPKPYGRWEAPIVHLPLLTTVSVPRVIRESTYRMRILGFLAAGVLAAVGMGLDRLVLAENGPGAINLPSNMSLGGVILNRGLHPETLGITADLISLALGRTFEIANVGLNVTKRQMVQSLNDRGYGPLIDLTNSCDRFPYSDADTHCGKCSSCLLRALAVLDHRSSFERLGTAKSPPISRIAAMYRSASMMHYLMLGKKIDRVLGSLWPMEELWALDPSTKAALQSIKLGNLLGMLTAFRQDITDLQSILEDALFDDKQVEQEYVTISGRT